MPNWCANTLKITAKTQEAKALLPQLVERFSKDESDEEGSAFNLIAPMPEGLKGTTAPSDGPNWYDWRVKNWGTKWSESQPFVRDNGDDTIIVYFDTAWGPPLGIYQRLVTMGFDVLATYAEIGIGFAGIWANGADDERDLVYSDDLDDMEMLEQAFQGSGLTSELLPQHIGG